MERVGFRDQDIETIRWNQQIEECEIRRLIWEKSAESIAEVIEEVEVLINTHLLNLFSETKSSTFLKRVIVYKKGPLQFRKGTIPQLLVSILYLLFGSRTFSIFCLWT